MQGNAERAVASIEAAEERFRDDLMFEYNAACVYGRVLLATREAEESDERDAAIEKYQQAGLAHLKRSIELGFSDLNHVRNDPDLEAFRDAPEYQELLDAAPEVEKANEAQLKQLNAQPAAAQKIQIQVGF